MYRYTKLFLDFRKKIAVIAFIVSCALGRNPVKLQKRRNKKYFESKQTLCSELKELFNQSKGAPGPIRSFRRK